MKEEYIEKINKALLKINDGEVLDMLYKMALKFADMPIKITKSKE